MITLRVIPPKSLTRSSKIMLRLNRNMNTIGKSIKARTKYHLNGRVLQKRTGNLRNSIEFDLRPIKDGTRLTIGSDVVYAKIHEKGGRAGRNLSAKIPKRPYLSRAVVDKKDIIRKKLTSYVGKIFRNG